jgi:release factor glutamine methyltransferase
VLLAFVRNCPRILLYTAFDEIVDAEQRQGFRELVRRRGQSEPVAYLVGIKEFFSIPLDVTPATLIPRPETEGLVVRALDVWKEEFSGKTGMRVLDVGTGSGALAIALASHMTDAIVTATDISQDALDIASANASKHSLDGRIKFLKSDVLEHPDLSRSWDIIVSNPPYVREDEFDGLPDDVRLYEPRDALVGGVTGCEIVQRLVQQASGSLVSGGWLFIEVGPSTVSLAERTISATTVLAGKPTVKDSSGLPRIVQARVV